MSSAYKIRSFSGWSLQVCLRWAVVYKQSGAKHHGAFLGQGGQQWHCGRCCAMKNNQDKSLNMIHEQICAQKDKSRTMRCSIYPDDRYSPALSLDQRPTRWYDFFSSNAKYGSIDKMDGILVPNQSFKWLRWCEALSCIFENHPEHENDSDFSRNCVELWETRADVKDFLIRCLGLHVWLKAIVSVGQTPVWKVRVRAINRWKMHESASHPLLTCA